MIQRTMRCKWAWLALVCSTLWLAGPLQAGDWTQFRGPQRDNVSEETGLMRDWPDAGPPVIWTTTVCQGYSSPAIVKGRVYLNDYDEKTKTWFVRCMTLADGKELWRFEEKRKIRPNHGITRSVPAVDEKYVFSLDPKCVFHCLDIATGKELWRKNLVREYKARIPPWYNGQCPLIEADRVIIGVGGEAMMVAFDKATGKEIWRTPNPDKWPLSHASVMPVKLRGEKQYLWCTLKGLMGVSAKDGRLLWVFPWKFNIAVAPSPVAIDDSRVFMTSGYDADSVMLRVNREADTWTAEEVFRLSSSQWNSEVHTPIVYKGHLFGVGRKKRGLFTCMDFDGNAIWSSKGKATFELGSFLLADGMFYALEGKTGMLRLLDANTHEYKELAAAQLLGGHDVWGPIAISDGKMIIRDMGKLICIDVAAKGASAEPTTVQAGAQPASLPEKGATVPSS